MILPNVFETAVKESRILYVRQNSSNQGSHMNGFVMNWEFINLCRGSMNLRNSLLDVNGLMQPNRYGRLNVSGTILSKRKLIKLVEGEEMTKPNLGKYVRGWVDPRLFTLVGLRRRGIPPGAILSFISKIGVTKAKTTIEIPKFESAVRTYLETLVPRLMLVLDPICVIIDNLPDDYIKMVEIPFSKDASHGSHFVPFTETVFIDRSDFREAPSKTFYRLSSGESVGLMKVQYPIIATSFELDPITDLVCTIRAIYANDSSSNKIDGSIKSYVALVGNCGSRERRDDILR
ncbi:Glutaminyl-tRNA synthetase [Ophidiomyces ophidiicola]|nr:Glutaminyl-tRNA synthetase [Ophidiomyces ophidiicola]